MLYREKGDTMRIDSTMPQQVNQMAARPQKEVAGEREMDGDADDAVKQMAKAPAQQMNPQGVGNKVDIFA
jgi:hypothetical protein